MTLLAVEGLACLEHRLFPCVVELSELHQEAHANLACREKHLGRRLDHDEVVEERDRQKPAPYRNSAGH